MVGWWDKSGVCVRRGDCGEKRREWQAYHHAMNAGGCCSQGTAVAVDGTVYGAAACGWAAAGLGGDESGAVA